MHAMPVSTVSESMRQFATRLKEHQKAVLSLNKGKSTLAEHVCETKYAMKTDQRRCLGAWYMNMNHYALN
jgi:hypothetical protein